MSTKCPEHSPDCQCTDERHRQEHNVIAFQRYTHRELINCITALKEETRASEQAKMAEEARAEKAERERDEWKTTAEHYRDILKKYADEGNWGVELDWGIKIGDLENRWGLGTNGYTLAQEALKNTKGDK